MTADGSRRGDEALTSLRRRSLSHCGNHFCTVSAPLLTLFFGAPFIIKHFHNKLRHRTKPASLDIGPWNLDSRIAPFLHHFCTIFHAFFGTALDYQPLPQQIAPSHQPFDSSVTATGQTPPPTPALWVPGSMKRIASSSPNCRNEKDEDMDANTPSRLDHGSWQTLLPTPALWVLGSMKRTRQIHTSRKTPMEDKKSRSPRRSNAKAGITHQQPNLKESHAYSRYSG